MTEYSGPVTPVSPDGAPILDTISALQQEVRDLKAERDEAVRLLRTIDAIGVAPRTFLGEVALFLERR